MTPQAITHSVMNASGGISGSIHCCVVGQQCAHAMSSEIKLHRVCTTPGRILSEASQMH